jgi:hypothetical protein
MCVHQLMQAGRGVMFGDRNVTLYIICDGGECTVWSNSDSAVNSL